MGSGVEHVIGIFGILGIIENVFVIYLVARVLKNGRSENMTHSLIMMLACADLLTSLWGFIMACVGWTGTVLTKFHSLCLFLGFVVPATWNQATFTLFVIAVFRFIAVTKSKLLKKRSFKIAIGVATFCNWFLLCIGVFALELQDVYPSGLYCAPLIFRSPSKYLVFSIIILVVVNTMVSLIQSLYCKIWKSFKALNADRQDMVSTEQQRKFLAQERRLAIQMVTLLCTHLALYTPAFAMYGFMLVTNTHASVQWDEVGLVFVQFTTIVNPLIYVLFNPKYRKEFKEVVPYEEISSTFRWRSTKRSRTTSTTNNRIPTISESAPVNSVSMTEV